MASSQNSTDICPKDNNEDRECDGGDSLEESHSLLSPNESIDLDKLQELRKIFDHADDDGGGGLDMEEFLAAFGKIFAESLNDQELTNLFMKIDANSDGTVDWNEFTEYMLLENEGKELIQANATNGFEFKQNDSLVEHLPQHRRAVQRIRDFEQSGLFATCSKDCSVTLWGTDCDGNPRLVKRIECPSVAELQASETAPVDHQARVNAKRYNQVKTEGLFGKKGGSEERPWVNDCVIMEHSKQLAIATSNRTIAFQGLGMAAASSRGRIFLDYLPMCLEYFHGQSIGEDVEVLVCADTLGYIHCWHLEAADWTFESAQKYARNSRGVRKYMRTRVHEDAITSMVYYDDLSCLVTCSPDSTVQFTDVADGRVKRSFLCHTKSVRSFAWIPAAKNIVSAGVERCILFWNPYTLSITSTLRDNVDAPVDQLQVSQVYDSTVLFVLFRTGKICLWDTMAKEFLYELKPASIGATLRDLRITSFLYIKRLKKMFACRPELLLWDAARLQQLERKSHNAPVSCAIFNEMFHQVVSVAGSEVHVWDLATGELVFRFINPHGDSIITAVTFDPSWRRLITGGADGSVKCFNFNTGGLLAEFRTTLAGKGARRRDCEIVALRAISGTFGRRNAKKVDYIIAARTDNRIFLFEDNRKEAVDCSIVIPLGKDNAKMHRKDISDLIIVPPNRLCSCGEEGELVSWYMQSGRFRKTFKRKKLRHTEVRMRLRMSTFKLEQTLDAETREEFNLLKQAHLKQTRVREGNSILNCHGRLVRRSSDRSLKLQLPALPVVKTVEDNDEAHLSAREGKCKGELLDEIESSQHAETSLEQRRKLGIPQPNKTAVKCITYIKKVDLVVSGGADGYLRFWKQEEALLAFEYECGHASAILSMCLDKDESKIFTGCENGRVRVFDISRLDTGVPSKTSHLLVLNHKEWNAHAEAVCSLRFIRFQNVGTPNMELLLSSSVDFLVKLWTHEGMSIGRFGQENPWHLNKVNTWFTGKTQAVKRKGGLAGKLASTANVQRELKRNGWRAIQAKAEREAKHDEERKHELYDKRRRKQFALSSTDEIIERSKSLLPSQSAPVIQSTRTS